MVGILLSKDGGQGGQRELLSFFLMECLVREEEIKGTWRDKGLRQNIGAGNRLHHCQTIASDYLSPAMRLWVQYKVVLLPDYCSNLSLYTCFLSLFMLHLHIEVDKLSYSCCSQSNWKCPHPALHSNWTHSRNKQGTHTHLPVWVDKHAGGRIAPVWTPAVPWFPPDGWTQMRNWWGEIPLHLWVTSDEEETRSQDLHHTLL